MGDERFVTSLLRRFSDRETGWISVRNSGSVILLMEFVRLFESFIRETEPQTPRRLRQLPWLRRTVVRCLDSWNILRNQDAQSTEDIATVELVGDHLTNVDVLRRNARHRSIRRRAPPSRSHLHRRNFTRGGDATPAPRHPKEPIQRNDNVPMKGEVSVRNEIAGAIIGRRGKTISTVRAETGSHVHVCESKDGWSRTVEIYGTKKQVIDAYHQVNAVIRREHPNYLRQREYVEMVTTVELKMGIALATYLTGMNGSVISEIQEKTGIVTTLHGVDGEEDSKKVRLTGNIDRILDAYHAVMAVLDTYEEWRVSNLSYEQDQGLQQQDSGGAQVVSLGTPQGPNGEVLQTSSVIVLQSDGSYKEMQIWVQPQQHTASILSSNAMSPPTLMNGRDFAQTQNQTLIPCSTPASLNQSSTTSSTFYPILPNDPLFGKTPVFGTSQQHQQQFQDPAGRLVSLLNNHRPGLMTGQGAGFHHQPSIQNHASTGVHAPSNGYSTMQDPSQGQVIIVPAEQTTTAARSIVYNSDELQNTMMASQSTHRR